MKSIDSKIVKSYFTIFFFSAVSSFCNRNLIKAEKRASVKKRGKGERKRENKVEKSGKKCRIISDLI